ncbi:MAG: serine protease [Methylacidiphilales bacterium]|nr:serine protease [Candidatus Methylacidiphilales bacterium]MDW8350018.1 NfeD family protein [Verrucomicrobiae bacterium]
MKCLCLPRLLFSAGLFLLLLNEWIWAAPAEGTQNPAKEAVLYVLPIRDDIEQTMVYKVRRGVKEAMENRAVALIIHMETNGGRLDSLEEIIKVLERFAPRERLYTYVDSKAFSAGAFIAAATPNIYMSPTAVIGAATPVMISPGGNAEGLPKSYEEKISSAVRAQVRAIAEKNGHRPEVFDAMVDRDQGLIIDGKEIVPKGKVLTLTATEACEVVGGRPLLASGVVENLDAMIAKVAKDLSLEGYRVVTFKPTGFEQLGRLVTMMAPVLLSLAFILGYIEFKTPGFGIFGTLAVICAVIFFFGHMVAGLSGYEPLVLFFLGVALILLEFLVFPGLILPGLVGIVLVVGAVIYSMADLYPSLEGISWPTVQNLRLPFYTLFQAFGLTTLAVLLIARYFPKRILFQNLERATFSGAGYDQGASEKIKGMGEKQPSLLGMTGQAITPLRPAGVAVFDGQRKDVITQGDFIEKGSSVRVVAVEGTKLIVTKI